MLATTDPAEGALLITPDDIRDQRFLVALRGYDRDEVGAFLEQVASEVANMQARVKELEALLAKERNRPSEPVREAASAESSAPDTRDLLKTLGEETTRILVTAEESAREIEHKASERAREELEQAKRQARDEAERAHRQAAKTIADAERRRDAIAATIRDLEAQRDRFVNDLTSAVRNVQAVSGGLASAGQAAGEEDADDGESEPATAAADAAEMAAPEATSTAGAPSADADDPQEADADDADEADAAAPTLSLDDTEGAVTTTIPTTVSLPAEETEPGPDDAADADGDVPSVVTASETAADDEDAGDEDAVDGEPDSVTGRRDAALDGLRPEMSRTLRRGLQDIQNGVLEAIRTVGDGPTLDDLLPADAGLDDLGMQGQASLQQAYLDGLTDAAAEVGGTAPTQLVDGARLPAASATLRAVLAHEVTSALRATLRAGLEAQEAPTSLSERVGEVFRDLKGPVLEGLVHQHLDRIYAHGLLDGWQELGVERIRWAVGDEPRCPEQRCRSNAAEGAVELGIDFPSGDRVPPAHPGCTCVIVPEDS